MLSEVTLFLINRSHRQNLNTPYKLRRALRLEACAKVREQNSYIKMDEAIKQGKPARTLVEHWLFAMNIRLQCTRNAIRAAQCVTAEL